jgi:hypothetical protein
MPNNPIQNAVVDKLQAELMYRLNTALAHAKQGRSDAAQAEIVEGSKSIKAIVEGMFLLLPRDAEVHAAVERLDAVADSNGQLGYQHRDIDTVVVALLTQPQNTDKFWEDVTRAVYETNGFTAAFMPWSELDQAKRDQMVTEIRGRYKYVRQERGRA